MSPSRPLTTLAHILGWLLFISLVLSFAYSMQRSDASVTRLLLPVLLFTLPYAALFYGNTHWLLPKLYLQGKHTQYFAVALLLFLLFVFLQPFDQLMHLDRPRPDGFPPPRPRDFPDRPFRGGPRRKGPDITGTVLFLMIWSLSSALVIVRQWRLTERRAAQAEADKANAELSFLKAQINPHFLFNTLNNIYSLALMKDEGAPEAILKLSHIMRYVTDEAVQDEVPLERELRNISHYIDLQKIRLSEKTIVDYTVQGETEGKRIAPLLLITFIENVFKYGISSHEPSPITIRLRVEENRLTLFCRNRIFKSTEGEERGGIGIANTGKRLDRLYPGRYTLDISSEEGIHTVTVTLEL